MSQPDWAKILSYLYNEQETISFLAGSDISETADIVSSTELDPQVIHDELERMERLDLVSIDSRSTAPGPATERRESYDRVAEYSLSEKGFDVAHERELRQEQQNLIENQSDATDTLADFTVILGVTALVQAAAAVVTANRYAIPLSIIYIILLGFLLYYRKQIFHQE